MRLLPKLIFGIVGVMTVPVVVFGTIRNRLAEQALRDRIEQDFVTLAGGTADDVRRSLTDIARTLDVYPHLVDFDLVPPEVAAGVLRVAYRAHDDILAVTFLDDGGAELLSAADLGEPPPQRASLSPAERQAFVRRVPLAAALARGVAISPPQGGRVTIAVASPRGTSRVLAAEVSLDRVHRRLQSLSASGTAVALVDRAGNVVAGDAAARPPAPLPATAAISSVEHQGRRTLTAYAPVGDLGLGVAVSEPEDTAFDAVSALSASLGLWLGAGFLAAILLAVMFARDLSRRVRALTAGASALAGGRFSRLDETGGDELADLARDFNRMADALERARHEVLASSRELERRVEQKSAELTAAEAELVRARSLAAASTLGAGVAHEINNPLTGLLGAAQLLLLDLPDGDRARPLVKEIEHQAQRIRAIVTNLLRIVRAEVAGDTRPLDLNAALDLAVVRVSEDLGRDHVTVERRFAADLPPVRGSEPLLVEAFAELLTNARRAMPGGGTVTLSSRADPGEPVEVRVADSGEGIDPAVIDRIFDPFFTTKSSWGSTGFGLTLVHKVVTDHGGRVRVESPPGQGATFVLSFPADLDGRR
jgi:two-component system NtrC family sensor kinase